MLLASTLGIPTKQGYIYTLRGGIQTSIATEILNKNGWSLDIGTTENRLFTGISRDIVNNDRIAVDVGAGITSYKELYGGIHFSF